MEIIFHSGLIFGAFCCEAKDAPDVRTAWLAKNKQATTKPTTSFTAIGSQIINPS